MGGEISKAFNTGLYQEKMRNHDITNQHHVVGEVRRDEVRLRITIRRREGEGGL